MGSDHENAAVSEDHYACQLHLVTGRRMEFAARVLVVYGVVSLSYGFLLGLPLSAVRMRSPEAPRHLVIAHLAAIIQGAVHLGLSTAVRLSNLPEGVELLAVGLLVGGSALFVSGSTANWLQGVGNHFAERSLGWRLLAVSGILHVAGMAIVAIGVFKAL